MIAKVLNPNCADGIQGDEHQVPDSGSNAADRFVDWIHMHLLRDSSSAILITRDGVHARYQLTRKGLEELTSEAPEGQ
jgi:hypothetical protein